VSASLGEGGAKPAFGAKYTDFPLLAPESAGQHIRKNPYPRPFSFSLQNLGLSLMGTAANTKKRLDPYQ
jgi:hypothetical protein